MKIKNNVLEISSSLSSGPSFYAYYFNGKLVNTVEDLFETIESFMKRDLPYIYKKDKLQEKKLRVPLNIISMVIGRYKEELEKFEKIYKMFREKDNLLLTKIESIKEFILDLEDIKTYLYLEREKINDS